MTETGKAPSTKLVLHYSVESGGDGSAYPKFFETASLAEWHQNHLDEGWGESCVGSVTVEGKEMSCPDLISKEGYYLTLLLDAYDDKDRRVLEEFKATFFPDGLPEFTVGICGEQHYGVYSGNRLVYQEFAYPEKKSNLAGIARLQKRIDSGGGRSSANDRK